MGVKVLSSVALDVVNPLLCVHMVVIYPSEYYYNGEKLRSMVYQEFEYGEVHCWHNRVANVHSLTFTDYFLTSDRFSDPILVNGQYENVNIYSLKKKLKPRILGKECFII